jgi:hypothetical protein
VISPLLIMRCTTSALDLLISTRAKKLRSSGKILITSRFRGIISFPVLEFVYISADLTSMERRDEDNVHS